MAIGLKILKGDFVITPSGSLELIKPGEKCKRDFGKMLITGSEYYSNTTTYYRYNPDYGTEIDNKVLYNNLSRVSIADVVTLKLNEAITRYLKLQETRANLNVEEIITNVKFDVYYNETYPNVLNIDIYYTDVIGDTQTMGEYQQMVG